MKMHALSDLLEAVNRMNISETLEELQSLQKTWEHGFTEACIMRDQFKEAAKSMSAALANYARSEQRKEKAASARQCYH